MLAPRVAERGERLPLLLEEAERDAENGGCTTVAILGAVSATFVTHRASASESAASEDALARASVAGAVELTLCGADKARFDELEVELRSPRAILQTVVARSPGPLPPLTAILPRREPGVPAEDTPAGPPPAPAPRAARAAAVERQQRDDGAERVERQALGASSTGAGWTLLALDAGCSRLDLLGADHARGGGSAVDLDASVTLAQTGETLASDSGNAPDASVSFCLGERAAVRLRFTGAAPFSEVLLVRSRWSLPAGLPPYFDARARARLAEALREHHAPPPVDSPIYSSLGISGVTMLPLAVEPGACYRLGAAVLDGPRSSLTLAVDAAGTTSENRSRDEAAGAALAFCVGAVERALVHVESRGAGVSWLLAVWQTGRVTLGEEPP